MAKSNTQFKPGVSGNPGGRPKGKVKELAARARELGPKAMDKLEAILDDPETSKRDALTAIQEVFNRGWGKPLAMTADVTNKLEDLDDEQLDTAIDVLRRAIGKEAAEEADSGQGTATRH